MGDSLLVHDSIIRVKKNETVKWSSGSNQIGGSISQTAKIKLEDDGLHEERNAQSIRTFLMYSSPHFSLPTKIINLYPQKF